MKIIKNQSLKDHNTFHLEAYAREMAFLKTDEDFYSIFDHFSFKDINYLLLGEGSNILFTKDFEGLILKTEQSNLEIIRENDKHTWIRIDAGLNWHQCVLKTIALGLQGLENLSLIPGTVGAAPVQNIGAYGVEIQQYVDTVETMDLFDQKIQQFSNRDCNFSYRSSIFKTKYKNRFFIKSLTLKLNKSPEYNISYDKLTETLSGMGYDELSPEKISKAIIRIRQGKLPDPVQTGNAGSFFKNPVIDEIDYEGLKAEFPGIQGYKTGPKTVKIPAAWLIEQCGLKGYQYKNTAVYHKQPLVLINKGNASADQILDLADKIRMAVSKRFGIELEPEVNIV